MSSANRFVAAVVAFLAVAVIAVVALRASGAPIGLGPDPMATPTPGASATASPTITPAATPSAGSSAPSDEEVQAILAQIEEQVIAIRGLPAADIGPAEIITRAELAGELLRIFDEQYPPEERERDTIELRALGLLEPDEDYFELYLELLGGGVRGFYDEIHERIVVVTDAGLDVTARIIYAHEYTHALQYAAFEPDSLETDLVGEGDRGFARLALVEGDATVTMVAWMFAHLEPAEMQEYFIGAEVPDTTGIPSWMVEQLAFPYGAGLTWTSALAGGDPTNPEFTDVDAAYADPPDSTEQIIDVQKWLSREAPDLVEVPDLAAALGAGWDEIDATSIGQATIEFMLRYLGVPTVDASEVADGWGGDRAVFVTGPDQAFALAWRLAWDTPADAAEFADAYETVVDVLDFPASVTQLPSGEVLVVHASSDELMAQTVAAAD